VSAGEGVERRGKTNGLTRSADPKNWSSSRSISVPRERFMVSVRSRNQYSGRKRRKGRGRQTAVHSVNSQVGIDNLPAHIGDVLRSSLADLGVVVLDGREKVEKRLRDLHAGEVGATLERRKSLYGHNTGYDGDGDTGSTETTTPIDEDYGGRGLAWVEKEETKERTLSIVEHLRDDEVRPSINLELEVADLSLGRLASGVTFGESGNLARQKRSEKRRKGESGTETHTNAEVVAVVLADVTDEVDSVVEPALDRLPLLSSARRVAAKSEDVAAARVVRFLRVGEVEWESAVSAGEPSVRGGLATHLQRRINRCDGHVRASQVHARLQAKVLVSGLDKVGRRLGGRSTSAPAVEEGEVSVSLRKGKKKVRETNVMSTKMGPSCCICSMRL
jgi:hypothetical protein